MPEHPHVKLGKYIDPGFPVYPQPPTRVIKRLGKLRDAFDVALDEHGEVDQTALFGSLGKRVYYLFVTFIPNLPDRMPEWEFWGYRGPDAFLADDFDEDLDGEGAATFPQWLDAFDVVVEVNAGKRFLETLGKVVPGDWVKIKIAELFEAGQDRLSGSPSSPGESGESPQKSSGTTGPTAESRALPPASGNGSTTPASSGIPQSA